MMQSEANFPASRHPMGERRRGGRAAVNRVLLYRTEPCGLLQPGRLTSLSLSGAGIALRESISAGAQLWIEIPATTPDTAAFVTPAAVVWAHPQDGTACLAGVAFERRPAPNAEPVHGLNANGQSRLLPRRPELKAARPLKPPAPRRTTVAAGMFALLLVLLIALLALLWPDFTAARHTTRALHEARVGLGSGEPILMSADEDLTLVEPPAVQPQAPGYVLGNPIEAAASQVPGRVGAAKAGPAELFNASERDTDASGLWSSTKEPQLDGASSSRLALAGLSGVPALEGSARISTAPGASLGSIAGEQNLIRLEVHTDEFLVWVLRGAEIVNAYPIGIGQQGSTPRGTYYIANKLEQPAWYNSGDPVAPGDPRNPIGDFWMGLGDANGATQYGFHPTSDPAVSGSRRSQGCIRMRPEDAAALFDLCEVGTEVRVI